MRIIVRLNAIAALFGASFILCLAQLPSVTLLLWLFLAASIFVSAIHFYFKKFSLLCIAHRMLWVAILFFCYACLMAHSRLSWQIPKTLENKSITVQGQIVSLPEEEAHHVRFIFSLKRVNQQNIDNKRVRLSWYGKSPKLRVGDDWQLRVKLKRLHGFANPGGFDYEAYALQHNLIASGYVRKSSDNVRLTSNSGHRYIDRIRQYLAQKIAVDLSDSSYRGMIQALVVGDKSAITAQQWQVLQKTGTNHLMVIAGLHIGMLSGVLFFIVYHLWRMSRFLTLRFAAKQAAAIAAVLAAMLYSALAGFSIPTVRATIMVLVFMMALAAKRNLSAGLGLSYALIIVLVVYPLASLSIGFWLSFAAVGTIFYAMSNRLAAAPHWWQLGKLQIVSGLGLIPFTLLMFQNASFISPLANAIVIPLVGFIVVPISLLASGLTLVSAQASAFLFHAAVCVLDWVWHILLFFASQPGFAWQHAIYHWWILLAAIIGIFILIAPRGIPAKYCGVMCCLPLFFYQPKPIPFGTVHFTLLDVGQGLASVVQTARHTLVFDTGAKYGDNFDMGQAVVLPFLRSRGIKQIDMMVISHGDNDHIGGAATILKTMPVNTIRTSVPQRFKQRASLCLAGQHWQWDGVQFQFLYPDKYHLNLDNNSSCVLLISTHGKRLLLTGDIEGVAEQYLVQHGAKKLRANVIVAPHHGSKTSSSLEFLKAVHPQWVLYPVGYLNRYHFPSEIVRQRYQTLGVRQIPTDSAGAINLQLAENTPIKPIAYRASQRRFWRQN